VCIAQGKYKMDTTVCLYLSGEMRISDWRANELANRTRASEHETLYIVFRGTNGARRDQYPDNFAR